MWAGGISHIQYVKKKLLKLEESALKSRNVELLHNIAVSKLCTAKVGQELEKRLIIQG